MTPRFDRLTNFYASPSPPYCKWPMMSMILAGKRGNGVQLSLITLSTLLFKPFLVSFFNILFLSEIKIIDLFWVQRSVLNQGHLPWFEVMTKWNELLRGRTFSCCDTNFVSRFSCSFRYFVWYIFYFPRFQHDKIY